jgi:succinate dehydrogenase / fumarate reductase iron-sulfur subunit
MVKTTSTHGHEATLRLTLRVWRQRRGQPGAFEDHALAAVPTSASFLEMMDLLNEQLIRQGA